MNQPFKNHFFFSALARKTCSDGENCGFRRIVNDLEMKSSQNSSDRATIKIIQKPIARRKVYLMPHQRSTALAYTKEMEFLHELSTRAGDELLRHFGTGVHVRHKQDNSLVTDADLASEKLILETIRKAYPKDLILSEEAGLSSTQRTPGQAIWVIDPLDGTTNFANSYPFFCVSIARAVFDDKGHVHTQAGAVHDPIRKKTYVAEKGKGAFANRKPISCTADRPMKDAFLATGFAYHSGENLRKGIEFFHAVADTCQSIRRDGAAALDLALVAEGVYDGYWESGLGAWDLAAGSLLVEEAGGKIENFSQSPLGYNMEAGNIVCGTPTVVQFILGLLHRRGSQL